MLSGEYGIAYDDDPQALSDTMDKRAVTKVISLLFIHFTPL
jgi:hypothetical protein